MRTLLILIACILSGCGLFRNRSVSLDKVKVQEKEDVRVVKSDSSFYKQIRQSNFVTLDSLGAVTRITADKVKIDSKGNISAQGNVNVQRNEDRLSKSDKSDVSNSSGGQVSKLDSAAEKSKIIDSKVKETETEHSWVPWLVMGSVVIVICSIIYLKK